jgi:hypothetical protein
VYAKTGSYEEAARQLNIDRRTVKSRVAPELPKRLRTESRHDLGRYHHFADGRTIPGVPNFFLML